MHRQRERRLQRTAHLPPGAVRQRRAERRHSGDVPVCARPPERVRRRPAVDERCRAKRRVAVHADVHPPQRPRCACACRTIHLKLCCYQFTVISRAAALAGAALSLLTVYDKGLQYEQRIVMLKRFAFGLEPCVAVLNLARMV